MDRIILGGSSARLLGHGCLLIYSGCKSYSSVACDMNAGTCSCLGDNLGFLQVHCDKKMSKRVMVGILEQNLSNTQRFLYDMGQLCGQVFLCRRETHPNQSLLF